ncbi:hypothetical protein D3C71_1432540 [compost metagenome]
MILGNDEYIFFTAQRNAYKPIIRSRRDLDADVYFIIQHLIQDIDRRDNLQLYLGESCMKIHEQWSEPIVQIGRKNTNY